MQERAKASISVLSQQGNSSGLARRAFSGVARARYHRADLTHPGQRQPFARHRHQFPVDPNPVIFSISCVRSRKNPGKASVVSRDHRIRIRRGHRIWTFRLGPALSAYAAAKPSDMCCRGAPTFSPFVHGGCAPKR